MADAPTPKGTRLIDFAPPEVTDKLIRLQVGGCTCMTKSPELRFHDARCTYRLAVEVQDLLNTAPTPSPPVAAPPATPVAPTDAMIDAGKKMLHASNGRAAREKVERIFLAMMAAQPQPAQPLTGSAPLSDEQIKAVCRSMLIRPWGIGSRPETAMAFARLIEAAHGITAPSTPTPEVAP